MRRQFAVRKLLGPVIGTAYQLIRFIKKLPASHQARVNVELALHWLAVKLGFSFPKTLPATPTPHLQPLGNRQSNQCPTPAPRVPSTLRSLQPLVSPMLAK
jgi:hypothetical protein